MNICTQCGGDRSEDDITYLYSKELFLYNEHKICMECIEDAVDAVYDIILYTQNGRSYDSEFTNACSISYLLDPPSVDDIEKQHE